VTAAVRKRILAGGEPGDVDRWLRRAAVVGAAKDLFERG
jgi:hypothetical protein